MFIKPLLSIIEANFVEPYDIKTNIISTNYNFTIKPRTRRASDHDTVVVYNTDTNSGGDLMP